MEDSKDFEVLDSNGNRLTEGDSVYLIKDLTEKGKSSTHKRGDVFKNIRLIDGDTEHILCKGGLYLRVEFVAKKK